MSEVQIDQAFVSDFIAQDFGLDIAHENAAYEPTPGTPYVEVTMFPAEVTPQDMANHDRATGFMQFILRYPEGAGAITAKLKAQAIFDAYPAGRVFAYAGQRVTVSSKARAAAVPEEGVFKVTGRIFYSADVARSTTNVVDLAQGFDSGFSLGFA